MTEQLRYQADLHSPPDDVDTVHAVLAEVWAASAHVPPTDRFRFETALVELSGNVFEHADPGGGLACSVTVTVSPDRLTAVVIDTGIPLEGSIDGGMPDELAESGRGLALIQALVDEVAYARDDDTNRWVLVHRLHDPV